MPEVSGLVLIDLAFGASESKTRPNVTKTL